MDKKYQVFISSTYQDLIEERSEVIKALLELDCIPTGMELFPSADDDQMTYIRKVIDNCDYYILIIGGRYGSLHKSGKSYTQLEYEYAIEMGIPVIAFLHANSSLISLSKSETSLKKKKKLSEFRFLAESKLCRYWNNPNELGALVGRSLEKQIKERPRNGWVKAYEKSLLQESEKYDKIINEILGLKEFMQIPKISPNVEKFKFIREELSKNSEKVELEITAIKSGVNKSAKFIIPGVGLPNSDVPDKYIIVLEESLQRRKLEINVGGFEAQAIVVTLQNVLPIRPLTHDLIVSIIQQTNIEFKEIIIDYFDLETHIFYSKLILKVSSIVIEIDCRTSDAIALAVRFEAPIYTFKSTFEIAYKYHPADLEL
jgi:bifunctional DNase/RNase